MPLSQSEAKELITEKLWPAFRDEKERLENIDKWYRWDHDRPHQPRHSTNEYRQLAAAAQTPWLNLIVTSVAQALYIDGYRHAGQGANAGPWRWWNANDLDARQIAINRAALAYGYSYATVLPGRNEFGEKLPAIRGVSPRRMITFYREPEHDEYPHYALRAEPAKVNGSQGYSIRVYDDERVYYLNGDSGGSSLEWIEYREHNLGICPVIRFTNQLDLEGRTPGEVEPFIPIAARIDQTEFDRLVVQRFASWKVRTIAGMAMNETTQATSETPEQAKLRLKVEDILIAEDKDTRFGTLDETPSDGFIKAAEHDIRVLAAASQTPAHEMLGQMANLSADALAAARASLDAKVEERQNSFGPSYKRVFRTAGHVMDDDEARRDVEAQVKWRDTSIRSLAQAADALGKMAKMLGVPVEALWEKIPGWDTHDVQNAKALAKEGNALADLTRLLEDQSA